VTHRYLISLDDPTCTNPDVAGSKAATLAQLKQAGFDVPEGMVLTATAFEDSVGDATEASIAAASLSASVEQALLSVSNRFGGVVVAVRSSSVAEDLTELSFAGQALREWGRRHLDWDEALPPLRHTTYGGDIDAHRLPKLREAHRPEPCRNAR
jgi:hypothetical protein